MEPYELIRSRRRTMALEITGDCRVLVRAPMHVTQAEADAFFNRHGDWVARHLERQRQEGGCPAAASYPGGDPGAEGPGAGSAAGKGGILEPKDRAGAFGREDYHGPEALRQLQRNQRPVLFLLFDELPRRGGGSGGGP